MFRSLTSLFIASIVLLVCLSTCDSVSAQFPPNKKIVYLRGPQNQEDLWVMNSDGSGQTQVCNCPGASDHSLSPDGLRIAFSRLNNVWVINTDGTGLINLTPSGGFAGQASWSPDSQEIAFTSNRDIVQGFHVQKSTESK